MDIRGTGESDGIINDEYEKQEQLDGLEILKWLAQQPWCTGEEAITLAPDQTVGLSNQAFLIMTAANQGIPVKLLFGSAALAFILVRPADG